MKLPVNIFWFRRDLRLNDNAGLYHALKEGKPVVPVFIFDRNILDELENSTDRRVEFIYHSLRQIQKQLLALGSTLDVRYGFPDQVWEQLIKDYPIANVFTNHDYEPYAMERDSDLAKMLKENNISFHTYKDQVIFEKNEVAKDDGRPYTIFTPYSKKWKATLNDFYLLSYPIEKNFSNFLQQQAKEIPSLVEMDFKPADQSFPGHAMGS